MRPAPGPRVSVVVPAYRPRDFVALRASMSGNADVDAEWIVVDDASGPAYLPLFDALRAEGVQVVTMPENRRQAAARNAGLALARGEWIKFLDADDRLDAGHLARLLAASGDTWPGPASPIAFASTLHVYPTGRVVENLSWRGMPESASVQLERLIVAPFLSHCGALFPRVLLQRLGGYDERLPTDEDGDLLIRVLQAGATFRAVPGVHYHYLHQDGVERVSRDDSPEKLAARLRVCEKVMASAAPEHLSPALRRAVAQRMDRIALSFWPGHPGEARRILAAARDLAPDYRPPGRWPFRLARRLAGPGGELALRGALQRVRGWIGRGPP